MKPKINLSVTESKDVTDKSLCCDGLEIVDI